MKINPSVHFWILDLAIYKMVLLFIIGLRNDHAWFIVLQNSLFPPDLTLFEQNDVIFSEYTLPENTLSRGEAVNPLSECSLTILNTV